MEIITRFLDFVNESMILEYRPKSEQTGAYSIFKITFSNGETHYGQLRGIIDPNVYLNTLRSGAKNAASKTRLQERILFEEPNPDTELVFFSKDEGEVVEKMKDLVKNDPDSINTLNMIGLKRRLGVKNKTISVPIDKTYLSSDDQIFIEMDYAMNDPELKLRVDLGKTAYNPINRKKYVKSKNKNYIKLISLEKPTEFSGETDYPYKELIPTEEMTADYIKQYFGLGKYSR